MKSYSLPSTQPSDNLQTDIQKAGAASDKSRTTLLVVVITLIATGFLIIKLQQSEPGTSAAASVAVIEKKDIPVKTTAEVKEVRRKKETGRPSNYIKAKIKWRKNLVGETVLEGTLTNMATLADFKDPVITITWLSKTNTPLATTSHPLYEYLGAKQTISYKMKVKAPAKYTAIKASVESATAL